MEKIMIVMVEHDPRQIEWAKACLSEYELVFADSWPEFCALTGSKADLIIFDPLLPDHMGGKPSDRIGLEVFKRAFYLLTIKRIKGLALISDHPRNLGEHSLCLGVIKMLISETGKVLGTGGGRFYSFSKSRNSLNVIITSAYDLWVSMPDICLIDPNGKIVSSKDIEKLFSGNQDFISAAIDCGYVPPKPYQGVVKALLSKNPGALRRKWI